MKIWIIEVLGIACGVSIIMSQAKWYAWFVEKIKNRKPFSCEMCMSFWVYLLYSTLVHGINIETVLNAFICSFTGYLISIKLCSW